MPQQYSTRRWEAGAFVHWFPSLTFVVLSQEALTPLKSLTTYAQVTRLCTASRKAVRQKSRERVALVCWRQKSGTVWGTVHYSCPEIMGAKEETWLNAPQVAATPWFICTESSTLSHLLWEIYQESWHFCGGEGIIIFSGFSCQRKRCWIMKLNIFWD